MQCFKKYGVRLVPKHQYHTLVEALEQAVIINKKPQQIYKVEPYKCLICGQYHVGKTNKMLNHKK